MESQQGELTAPASFVVEGDGFQTWSVTTLDGTSTVSGRIRIDGDGPPTVQFGAPVAGGIYPTGVRKLNVICTDTSGADCSYTINGTPIRPGDPLPTQPGSYTLDFVAIDKIGNETRGSIGFAIEAVDAPPIVSDLTVSGELVPVGVPVQVGASFADASGLVRHVHGIHRLG